MKNKPIWGILILVLSIVCLLPQILHAQVQPKVKKIQKIEKKIPAADQLTPNQVFDLNLPQNGKTNFKIACTGNLVVMQVDFRMQDEPKADSKAPMNQARNINAYKQSLEQARLSSIPKQNLLTVYVQTKWARYYPDPVFSTHHSFAFEIENPGDTGFEAVVMVSNNTPNTLKGKLLVTQQENNKRIALQQAEKRQLLDATIKKMENTDILQVYYHTLKRHLNNYPGGKSDIDLAFSNKAKQYNVNNSTLQQIYTELMPFESNIAAKTTDSKLRNISLNKPLRRVELPRKMVTSPIEPQQSLSDQVRGQKTTFLLFQKPGFYLGGYTPALNKRKEAGMMAYERNSPENIMATTFNVLPGKSNQQYITLEVSGKPGMYLIESNGFPAIVPFNEGHWTAEQATFKIIPARNGKPLPWVSVESVGRPGNYLGWDLETDAYYGNCFVTNWVTPDQSSFQLPNQFEQFENAPKYLFSMALEGIKSERCRDDHGGCQDLELWWDCCDPEEPYVAWSIFGPNMVRFDVTDKGSDVIGGSVYSPFTEGSILLDRTAIAGPIFFSLQVRESDPGGPSRDQIMDAVMQTIDFINDLVSGNWIGATIDGIALIFDIGNIISTIGAADDLYSTAIMYFPNEQDLTQMTSGVGGFIGDITSCCLTPYNGGQAYYRAFQDGGVLCVPVRGINSAVKQWTLYLKIFREPNEVN